MKIGIDARFLGSSARGLGRYVSQLLHELGTLDTSNEYFVFITKTAQQPEIPLNFRFVRTRIKWYGFSEQLLWPLLLLKYNVDVMHFAHFNVPLAYRKKFIVTIHDVILLSYPTTHASTHSRWYFSLKYAVYLAILRHAINASSHIITISEFSKSDIEKHYPKSKDKIIVTYEGTALGRMHAHPDNDVSIKKPYVLYVGTAYPHKNLEWTIKAFLEWRKHRQGNEIFVLVGQHDSFYQRLIDHFKDQHRLVQFLSSVTDQQLAQLYRNASAYIAPSLYEGFGLPALESLEFGLPVLASNRTAQPEILGNAALYFEPDDSNDFSSKLTTLLDDAAARSELTAHAKSRVTLFDWKVMAERTKKLYEST